MNRERTPWPTLLAIAASLGIAPAHFWRLSLREWRALVAPARAALSQQELRALSARYPDETK